MDSRYYKRIHALYLEMYDKLMAYARVSMQKESLAEEVVHETFCIACQKAEAVCNHPNPKGWLFLTLKNTIKNMKRTRATASRILEAYFRERLRDDSAHEDQVSLKILYRDLTDSDDFKILYEMAVMGRSRAEIAQARGITVNACKKRVQRAKEVLRKKLEK